MKRITGLTVFSTALSLASATWALPPVDPGLWEHQYSIKSESGELERAMEQARQMMQNMPPEQRQMVENMMQSQGISFDFTDNTLRICITPEQAARKELPQIGNDCSQEILSQSDTEMRIRFTCNTEPPSSGEGTIRVLSSKEYTGEMTFTMQANGQPEKMTATTHGNWISADCGDLETENEGAWRPESTE